MVIVTEVVSENTTFAAPTVSVGGKIGKYINSTNFRINALSNYYIPRGLTLSEIRGSSDNVVADACIRIYDHASKIMSRWETLSLMIFVVSMTHVTSTGSRRVSPSILSHMNVTRRGMGVCPTGELSFVGLSSIIFEYLSHKLVEKEVQYQRLAYDFYMKDMLEVVTDARRFKSSLDEFVF